MIDNELWIYKKFRHAPVFQGSGMLEYMKMRFPNHDIHHLLGSMSRSMKLNDYLLVPLTRQEHIWAEGHKAEAFFKYFYDAVLYLFEYVQYLEGKNTDVF